MANERQPKVTIKDFHLGGIADSIYSGVANSLASMVGWDIHGIAGRLQVHQAMAKISESTITELCKVGIKASNGYIYWMSSESGKVWKQDPSDDSVTLLDTIVPTTGSAAILSAKEHAGYVYLATANYLHRIAISNEAVTQNWQALANQASYHPMKNVNLMLYIGDGNDVHQINESNTYTADALDLPVGYEITALGKSGKKLLIGAYLGAGTNSATIFKWNTWSDSWESDDDVPEEGIWAILEADNFVLIFAGKSGNMYYYTGEGLEHYKKVQGTYTPTAEAMVHPNAVAVLNGNEYLFGMSNVTGTPTKAGIWSLGRNSRNYPFVLNLPFPISQVDGNGYNKTGAIEVGAIVVAGVDVYCSWKDSSTFGVDKLDYSAKVAKPYVETRVIVPDNIDLSSFSEFIAGYSELPENTSIVMKTQNNYEGSFANTLTVTPETDKMLVRADADRADARTLQLRVECVSSGNDAPSLDEIVVLLE